MIKKLSSVMYLIRAKYLQAPERRVHVGQLRPYYYEKPNFTEGKVSHAENPRISNTEALNFGHQHDKNFAKVDPVKGVTKHVRDPRKGLTFRIREGNPVIVYVEDDPQRSVPKLAITHPIGSCINDVFSQSDDELLVTLMHNSEPLIYGKQFVFDTLTQKHLIPMNTRVDRRMAKVDRILAYIAAVDPEDGIIYG